MIHLCVKVKRNNAIMKTRDRVFAGNFVCEISELYAIKLIYVYLLHPARWIFCILHCKLTPNLVYICTYFCYQDLFFNNCWLNIAHTHMVESWILDTFA